MCGEEGENGEGMEMEAHGVKRSEEAVAGTARVPAPACGHPRFNANPATDVRAFQLANTSGCFAQSGPGEMQTRSMRLWLPPATRRYPHPPEPVEAVESW